MNTTPKETAMSKLAGIKTPATQKTLEENAQKIFEVLRNDDQYELLSTNLDLLQTFAFRVHEQAIESLEAFIHRAQVLEIKYEDAYHAKYSKNLTVKALDTLFTLRYMDVEKVSSILIEQIKTDGEGKNPSAGLLKKYVGYDLNALGKIGYYPQRTIINQIKQLSVEELCSIQDELIPVLTTIFEGTAESTSSDYKTITWSTRTIDVTNVLKEIRLDTIELLISHHQNCEDVSQKLKIMSALRNATSLPHQSKTPYGDDWISMIKDDFLKISDYYSSIYDDMGFLEIQEVEHQVYWFAKRGIEFKDMEVGASTLSNKLKSNQEYQYFKTIMGDDRSYSSYWEDSDWSFEKSREFRKNKIDEYLDDIGDDFPSWKKRLLSYLEESDETSSGMHEFMPYFMKNLGIKHPEHALDLVSNNAIAFEKYLIPLMLGLVEDGKTEEVNKISDAWLSQGQFLDVIIRLDDSYEAKQKEYLSKAINKAIETSNVDAIRFSLSIVSMRYKEDADFYKSEFLKCVQALRQQKQPWSRWGWFRPEVSQLITELPEEEIDYLLGTLVDETKIDYNEEGKLKDVAHKYPLKVVKVFEDRIKRQIEERKKEELVPKYDAIPFSLYNLHEPLAKNGRIILPIMFDWYKRDDWLFRWDGARLIANIFASVDGVLADFLIDKIKTGAKDDACQALHILKEYDGNPKILPVCIEAIKEHPNDDDIRGAVHIALDSSGVVSGEFGMRDAYVGKMSFVEEMRKVEDERVQSFADHYEECLKRDIERETERAKKGMAIRKKVWGDNEVDSSES